MLKYSIRFKSSRPRGVVRVAGMDIKVSEDQKRINLINKQQLAENIILQCCVHSLFMLPPSGHLSIKL